MAAKCPECGAELTGSGKVCHSCHRIFSDVPVRPPTKPGNASDAIICAICNQSVARGEAVRRDGKLYCLRCAADRPPTSCKELPRSTSPAQPTRVRLAPLLGPHWFAVAAVVSIIIFVTLLFAILRRSDHSHSGMLAGRVDSPSDHRAHPSADKSSTSDEHKKAPSKRNRGQEESTTEPLTLADVISVAEKSVALIHDGSRAGTGFLVRRDIVATNAHVLREILKHQAKVVFPSVSEISFAIERVVFEDQDHDLCLVQIENPGLPPMTVASDSGIRRGDEVVIIGNPSIDDKLILRNAVAKGMLSSETDIDGEDFYQFDASVNPGNSGGPAIDLEGRVVAIITLKASKQERIAFGIPAKYLRDALSRIDGQEEKYLCSVAAYHDARVIYRRMVGTGIMGLIVMKGYILAMDTAVENGFSASTGLSWVHTEKTERQVSKFETKYWSGLDVALHDLRLNRALDSDSKKKLVELWSVVQEIRGYATNPRGTLLSYKEKADSLQDEMARLVNQLKIELGVRAAPEEAP